MPPKKPVYESRRCGAKRHGSEERCKNWALDNGRCRLHGGMTPGGPFGNSKARKHGLFSKALDETGRAFVEAAKKVPTEELARASAEFLLGRVVSACRTDTELKGATALAVAQVEQMMAADLIGPDAGASIIRKLREPNITEVAKALGPLRGLLEVAQPPLDKDAPAEGATTQPVIQIPMADWLELVKPAAAHSPASDATD